MPNRKEVHTISKIERMNSSKNGNPRFRVHFAEGYSAATEPDGAVAYGIENPEFKNVPVEFEFNGQGHIVYAVPTLQS